MKILLICSFVLFIAGGSFLMFHKTESDPVKIALSEYHAQKKQSISITSIEYRACSEYLPDSIAFFEVAKKALYYGKESNMYYNNKQERDSLMRIHDQLYPTALSMQSAMQSKGKGSDIFTRCNYIATIATDKEQFTDTLTAILNDKNEVIWPD